MNDTQTHNATLTQDKRTATEISSLELFRGRRLVLIQHGEDQYRLMVTKNGKLILQK